MSDEPRRIRVAILCVVFLSGTPELEQKFKIEKNKTTHVHVGSTGKGSRIQKESEALGSA